MNQIAPVKKELVVAATTEKAFRVFTDGIDTWWPRQHHIGSAPLRRTMIEPRQGGRWYSESMDDTECDIGRVLVWDPPGRLVLAWQITADWKFDPAFVTEVEVTFSSAGPKSTKVTLEHRNLERYGEKAEAIRNMIGADAGWGLIMKGFEDAVNA